jgi:hypothetical protein
VTREKTGILIMIGLRRDGNGNGVMLKTSQKNRRKNRGKLNGLVLDGKDGRIRWKDKHGSLDGFDN